jgi:hypothetical protein
MFFSEVAPWRKKSRDGKVTAPVEALSEFAPLPYAGFIRIRFKGSQAAPVSVLANSPSWLKAVVYTDSILLESQLFSGFCLYSAQHKW